MQDKAKGSPYVSIAKLVAAVKAETLEFHQEARDIESGKRARRKKSDRPPLSVTRVSMPKRRNVSVLQ
jgi:hypothetical protein